MIISAENKEQAILTNVRLTLEQIKQGGKANQKLVLEHISIVDDEYLPNCTVDYYIDSERTQLLFSEDTDANPDSFSTQGTRTLHTPPDEKINFAQGLSNQFAQALYYVTATFSDGEVIEQTYRNIDNLMFQSVIVTTKANAKFITNDNSVMIYPRSESISNYAANDDLTFATFPMDLYINLNVFNWEKLSEENRWIEGQNVTNIIRNALYADRYRDGNCTLLDKDLQGTNVGNITILPSDAVLKGKIEVKTAFYVSPTTY